MKILVLCLSLLFSGAVCADELSDAKTLFDKKAYQQALQLYTKLSNAGNPEAQLLLGQMYWYGEAGGVDETRAQDLFRQSAAKGNKIAAAALEVMKQRVVRRADIDYWTSKYDGADLTSGKFACPAPRIPAISKLSEEIDSVAAKVQAWQECYNGFVQNLNQAVPLIKRIPPDIAALLNEEEIARATRYLDEVQAGIAENAKVSSKLVLADVGAWRSATDAYVTEHNAIVRSAPSVDRQQDIEARKRNYAPGK